MKTFFVGIDISKDWLDVAICNDSSLDYSDTFRVVNSINGIRKMIRQCVKIDKQAELWFCFEHTGNYGLLLSHLLEQAQFTYSAVPAIEIIKSVGMTRGKNDMVDARRIARYAATNRLKLKKTSLPGEAIMRIKSLLTYRDQLVKISTQLQNSLKSYLITQRSNDVSDIINQIKEKIAEFKNNISKTEQDILTSINSDQQVKKTFEQTITVKGIGPIIAATMIVITNNFTSFDNPRKFNSYAGLAPFEFSSGSSIRGVTKTHYYRNKNMKRLLFNGANTAAIYDLELKKFYKRKKEQGKHHMSIINAIACKLVSRVFAVTKRDEPFVNLVR